MSLKELTNWTVGVGVCVISVVVGLYMYNFGDGTFSINKAEWGAFGDYVGGVVNPLTALANLAFLVYVSYQISELDKARTEGELEMQKKIALYGLKNDAYKELDELLRKIQDSVLPVSDKTADEIILLRQSLVSFFTIKRHLIKELDQSDPAPIMETMTEMIEICEEILHNNRSAPHAQYRVNHDRLVEDLVVRLTLFNQQRSDLLQFVFRQSIA